MSLPETCPFCGASPYVMADGKPCRGGDSWVLFCCDTALHAGQDIRRTQSRKCEGLERTRLAERILALDGELARIQDAYLAAVQNMHEAERKVTSANLRLDCSLTKGNRLRNVMRMLRSPDEETRLLASRRADEWDEFCRITTDSRNASKAWQASNESQCIEKVEGGAR